MRPWHSFHSLLYIYSINEPDCHVILRLKMHALRQRYKILRDDTYHAQRSKTILERQNMMLCQQVPTYFELLNNWLLFIVSSSVTAEQFSEGDNSYYCFFVVRLWWLRHRASVSSANYISFVKNSQQRPSPSHTFTPNPLGISKW